MIEWKTVLPSKNRGFAKEIEGKKSLALNNIVFVQELGNLNTI